MFTMVYAFCVHVHLHCVSHAVYMTVKAYKIMILHCITRIWIGSHAAGLHW